MDVIEEKSVQTARSSPFTLRSSRSSRMSFASGKTGDKRRRSMSGRRSSIIVSQTEGDVEYTKEVVLMDDMAKEADEKTSSFLAKKATSVEAGIEGFRNYMSKLVNEGERWDELFQKYADEVIAVKSDAEKPKMLSAKFVEQTRAECIGAGRVGPSPLEFTLALVHFLRKEAKESLIPRIEQLKMDITTEENKHHRLQEAIKIQEKYMHRYESEDELLKQRADYDRIISEIENWMAKYGFSERLFASITPAAGDS